MLLQSETKIEPDLRLASRKHHQETEETQRTFLDTVAKLCTAIEGMGNPFEEESPDLLIQNAKDIADPIKAERRLEAKQTWHVFEEVSSTFTKLSQSLLKLDDSDLHILEKFVVTIYDRSSTASAVRETRLHLFARKQRSCLSIPPTQASLMEHAKGVAYQAGMIWVQTLDPQPDIQYNVQQSGVGSNEVTYWQVHWTDLAPKATSSQELTNRGRQKGCTRRCKCYKWGLTNTAICNCMCQNLVVSFLRYIKDCSI